MAVITDTTFTRIKSEIGRRNEILNDLADVFTVTGWQRIRNDVRMLTSEELATKYPVGMEFDCDYVLNGTKYNFPWVVLDNNRVCVWEDGTEHQGLWLGAKYATAEMMEFDAPENTVATEQTAQSGWYYFYKSGTDYIALNLSEGDAIPYSTYTTVYKTGINDVRVVKDGYNRYKDCAIRQWLNSSKKKGNWWTAQHLGDVAPTKHGTYDGFLAGLDSDFVDVITPVQIKTAANTLTDGGVTDIVYDKFFQQSVEEVYGVHTAPGVEGPYFPYWKNVTGLDSPSNGGSTESDTNDARKIKGVDDTSGSAVIARLRSARQPVAYSVWHFHSNGYLANGLCQYATYRMLPACVIS